MAGGLFSYTHIATNTETVVKTGPGFLKRIVVNTAAAGAITVADAASGTTPAIAIFKASVAEGSYSFECDFSTGLVITTAAASDLTVVWR